MNNGSVFVEQKVLDRIWCEPFTMRLYLLLAARAVEKECVLSNEVKVERGQYLRSYSLLAEDLVYVANGNLQVPSTNTVKRSADRLVDLGFIKTEETKYGTLFTIIQDSRDEIFFHENDRTASNQQEKPGNPTEVQQEELKKDKKEKEIKDQEPMERSLELANPLQKKIQEVTNAFLKLRQSSSSICQKQISGIKRVCLLDVNCALIIEWMKEILDQYHKKNPGKKIHSFLYFEKAVLTRYRARAGVPAAAHSSAHRDKLDESDEFLKKLEKWKQEGEKHLANKRRIPSPLFLGGMGAVSPQYG
ncbi:MAG: DNA helicase [Bacillota bacterium]